MAIQNNVMTNGGNVSGLSLESVIIADLEFLGLAKKDGYEHRPVREVEASVSPVPEDVSGVLMVAGRPGAAVVSESQARANRRRIEEADARIAALFADRQERQVSAPTEPAPEPGTVSGGLVLGPIAMPAGEPTQLWWAQFCRSGNERLVQQRAAEWFCQTLARETLRGQHARIEFEGDVSVGELLSALERISGPRGWRILLKKAGLA